MLVSLVVKSINLVNDQFLISRIVSNNQQIKTKSTKLYEEVK